MRIRNKLLTLAAIPLTILACEKGQPLLTPGEGGPRLAITTVSVTCPDTISVGQTAQCVAYAYDQNNQLVSPASFTWSTTTPSLVSLSSTGQATGLAVGSAVVQATSAGVTGSRNVYVKPGLSVSLGGPSPVQRYTVCTWGALVYGGTPPYSYSWYKLGGTGTSYGYYWSGQLISTQMTLRVTVTDANGVQKVAERLIMASLDAPEC